MDFLLIFLFFPLIAISYPTKLSEQCLGSQVILLESHKEKLDPSLESLFRALTTFLAKPRLF